MPVTLTDEQARQVRQLIEEGQQAKNALKGVQTVWNDPKTSDRAKALWKEAFPDSQVDGYDQKVELQGIVNGFKKEREDEKREAEIAARTQRAKNQRTEAQQRHGFTEEAMGRLDKLMEEKEIYDYEAGALLLASREPKPSDGSGDRGSGHFWQHDKQPAFKEISADPEKWGYEEIYKAAKADQDAQRNRF
jgi:hypothetical protein